MAGLGGGGELVALGCFIEAIRDAGYRGPGAALAELIDNAFEAQATTVDISLTTTTDDITVIVQDDGYGMSPSVLRLALQFGGTTRFDSRSGLGRYGMGLPAASLSQAQRLDVYTWTSKSNVWWSYLDVEQVRTGQMRAVPEPRRRRPPVSPTARSGTIITWSLCDRLRLLDMSGLEAVLRAELGRVFRELLWSGRVLVLNGTPIEPIDPLLCSGQNHVGATPYGSELEFPIEVADDRGRRRVSKVVVRFVELPVAAWQGLSNQEKQRRGISKRAGISVLRSGREIDSGWFFMGNKRKENYDDWWRGEVRFAPELDELFGVSHIKQGIRPTGALVSILAPDMERVAHELNSRVRRTFIGLRRAADVGKAAKHATSRDRLLEPPAGHRRRRAKGAYVVSGVSYRIADVELHDGCFFEPRFHRGELALALNREHPFFDMISRDEMDGRQALQLLLLAAARAEIWQRGGDRRVLKRFRRRWSTALTAFLS